MMRHFLTAKTILLLAAGVLLCITSMLRAQATYGLDHLPQWAPPQYTQSTDIPANAVDYATGNGGSAFASLEDAAAYCVSHDKPLKINVDVSTATLGFKCPKGIYGYGPTKPTITYTGSTLQKNTPALFYVWNHSVTFRWLKFEGFGDVLDVACGSYDRDSDGVYWEQFGDSSSAGFLRAVPPGYPVGGSGGTGIQIDTSVWPITTLGNPGPSFDIQECEFIDCQQVVFYLTDSLKPGHSKFGRNKLVGTYGGVALHASVLGDFDAWMNEWTGLNAADTRGAIPAHFIGTSTDTKANRFHTLFALGAEYFGDIDVATQTIRIWSNYVHGVEDDYNNDTVNAATFVDMRGNNPTSITGGGDPDDFDCSVSIKHNRIEHLYGRQGQEDANAIYTKSLGHCIEGNWIEDTGSDYVYSGNGDGTETAAVLSKEPGFTYAQPDTAWCCRNNVYVDMPAVSDGLGNRDIVKVANPQVDWFVVDESFIDCSYQATGGTGGMLRRTDDSSGANVAFYGYITGDTLTVTSMISGTIRTGIRFVGAGGAGVAGTQIVDQIYGDTYLVEPSQTTGSPSSPVAFYQICQTVIKGVRFFNCPSNGHQVYFHEPKASFGFVTTIADNSLYHGADVDYSAAAMFVGSDGSGVSTWRSRVSRANNRFVGSGNTYLAKIDPGDTGGPYGAMSVPDEPTMWNGLLLTDDFQDGNASGWSTDGGSWSVVTDGSYQYKQSSTSGRSYAIIGSNAWTDYSVQAKLKPLSFASAAAPGLCMRWVDRSNFYACRYDTSTGTLQILRKVSSTVTILASKSYTISTGTTYTFKAATNGDTLEFFVNGLKELTATDSAFTSGKIALLSYRTAAEFDDVVVKAAR